MPLPRSLVVLEAASQPLSPKALCQTLPPNPKPYTPQTLNPKPKAYAGTLNPQADAQFQEEPAKPQLTPKLENPHP